MEPYATSLCEGARKNLVNRYGITVPRLCVETITPSLVHIVISFLGFSHTRRRHNAFLCLDMVNQIRSKYIIKIRIIVRLSLNITYSRLKITEIGENMSVRDFDYVPFICGMIAYYNICGFALLRDGGVYLFAIE